MNPGHNATGQNATAQNATAQIPPGQNATRKIDSRAKCHYVKILNIVNRSTRLTRLPRSNYQLPDLFGETWNLDREYLRNDSRYPKSERNVIDSDSSRVLWKKSGELWSTNKKVLLANIEPPKCIFRGRLHLGPQGVLPPQIFTRARDWPRLPSAHPNGDGGPPQKKKINRENLKFGLKLSVLPTITSGLVGVSSQNIFHTTCRETGVITCV